MQNSFIDNLWLKLGAILLALLLWFHVATDKSYEYTVSYGLKLKNPPPKLILAEPLPDKIQVKIYGKGKELLKLLLSKERSLKIDAQKFTPGVFELELKKEMIELPQELNLSVIEIFSPKTLKINLQKVEAKEVPIISQVSFSLGEDYFQQGEIKFTPEKVNLKGPAENVEKIRFVLTQKKEFKDLKSSFSGSIELITPSLFNLMISPKKADFSVEIEKGEKTKLEKIPITMINLPRGRKAQLEPRTISLELLGKKEILEKLTPENVKVIVDCKEFKRGQAKVIPLIQLPENILLLKTEPESLSLEIN